MPPSKPTAGFWITVALFVVLVGYPLNLGPVLWSVTKVPTAIGEAILVAHHYFYKPLVWLAEEISAFDSVMGWHVDLWVG